MCLVHVIRLNKKVFIKTYKKKLALKLATAILKLQYTPHIPFNSFSIPKPTSH